MSGPKFDKQAFPAFIIACITLAVCFLGFQGAVQALNLYLKKEAVELRQPLSLISTSLGRWRAVGPDGVLDEAMIQELGTNKYLDRMYALDGNQQSGVLKVHLAYYTGMIDTVPHVPDRCLVAAGFDQKTLPANLPLNIDRSTWKPDPQGLANLSRGEVYQVVEHLDLLGRLEDVRMPIGEMKLRTVQFEESRRPEMRIFGGYFFIANGRIAVSPEDVKMLAFNIRERFAYYCKVQFMYWGHEATQERFLELSEDLLKEMLPELMRCLPDWSEVERRPAGGRQSSELSST
jgi:hypothetical protein